MSAEEVRSDLGAVREGAEEFAASVQQIAAEERYVTLPDRALQVAELATQMAEMLKGIYADARDFNYKVGELSNTTCTRLGGMAARAMEGSSDADAKYYITMGAGALVSATYQPEYYNNGKPLRPQDAVEMAKTAQTMAAQFRTEQRDIESVAPGYAGDLKKAIDSYLEKL